MQDCIVQVCWYTAVRQSFVQVLRSECSSQGNMEEYIQNIEKADPSLKMKYLSWQISFIFI